MILTTSSAQHLHILKKDQHFDAKSAQNLNILKKIQNFDSEKPPNLHILKKSKISKTNSSMPVSPTDFFLFFWLYAGLVTFHYHFFVFFEYMQVLCTFGIKMLIFFEYMLVWWTSSLKPTFLQPSNDMILFNLFSSFNIYLIKFKGKQIRIVLISSLIFDQLFIVIQNIDNIIILRILILWI